jgi:hypothetical protein
VKFKVANINRNEKTSHYSEKNKKEKRKKKKDSLAQQSTPARFKAANINRIKNFHSTIKKLKKYFYYLKSFFYPQPKKKGGGGGLVWLKQIKNLKLCGNLENEAFL